MPANFDLAALAVKMACPTNEVLYDDKGMPSVMVRLPKKTYKELGLGSSTAVHPAWIVNGTEVDEIFISKFQNIVKNGRAYSLPGQDPKTSTSSLSAIRVVSSTQLRLLLFLLETLTPAYNSSSLAFLMMCSVYKLNKLKKEEK